ncbi:MAG: RNA methyltransferase [Candidatus Cloacimonetes bacterium]|nr:RNA methyltransferase [Candidatus Cloacimonadota bacterium]
MHYPVLNKNGESIMTSLVNLDIHDLARSGKTFGIAGCYLITPDEGQTTLIHHITEFWRSAPALMYNPHRSEALSLIKTGSSIEDCMNEITNREGMRPKVITTTARKLDSQISFAQIAMIVGSEPVLILFGTGYGLTDETHTAADCILAPIEGNGEYNHLSVRSAVAIVLDRISSEK